jgi:spore coat protein SA
LLHEALGERFQMIYHILSEAEPFSEHHGGALSRWTANVLRGDDNCTIICPWADDTWGFSSQQIETVFSLRQYLWWSKTIRYKFAIGMRLRLLRSVFAPVLQKLKRGDAVYIHNRPEFALALSPILREKGVQIALHMQNSHLLAVPASYQSSLDVDALIFCSAFLRTEASQFVARTATAVVIPNGADENCFFPRQCGTVPQLGNPAVLFVGRLVPEKGIHVFANALRLLLQKGVGVTGRIIGSTGFGHNKSSRYVERIKRELPSNVHFAVYASGNKLAEEFRRTSIFCCPSVWNEPFGMVNVEAMATRLPVVASAVGGIPEIFEQGGGILVRPGSSEELADAIEFLVSNPMKRHELAEQGFQAYRSRYRWQHIRSQYRDLVRQVLPVAA